MPKISRQSYYIVVVTVRRDHLQEHFCIKTLTTMVATVSSFLMRSNWGRGIPRLILVDLGNSRVLGPNIHRFEPQKYHSSSIKFLGKRTGSRPTMMARTTDPYSELFSAAFLVSTSHIEVNTRCRLSLTNDGLNQYCPQSYISQVL